MSFNHCEGPQSSDDLASSLRSALSRSCNRKGENTLGWDPDFLLACGGGNSGSCTGSCYCADGSPFAASRNCANQRSCTCTAPDLSGIALGVTLALSRNARAVNSLSVDGTQAQCERARFVEASATVHIGNFAFDRSARVDHDLAMFNNVMRKSAAPDLAGVRRG
jgi:hypothetical protein